VRRCLQQRILSRTNPSGSAPTGERAPNYSSIATHVLLVASESNRGFGFLTNRYSHAENGKVACAVSKGADRPRSGDFRSYYDLTISERVCYTACYLEVDGGLMLPLGTLIVNAGTISYTELADQFNPLIQRTISDALYAASTTPERLAIRRIIASTRSQMKSELYEADTLAHKLRPRLEYLEDLGLVEWDRESDSVSVREIPGGSGLKGLTTQLSAPDLLDLAVARGTLLANVGACLGVPGVEFDPLRDRELALVAIKRAYEEVRDSAFGLAALHSIGRLSGILLLTEHGIRLTTETVIETLEEMRRRGKTGVKFHMDGAGRIAFVRVDPASW
jgi:hypothetical protein